MSSYEAIAVASNFKKNSDMESYFGDRIEHMSNSDFALKQDSFLREADEQLYSVSCYQVPGIPVRVAFAYTLKGADEIEHFSWVQL